MPPITPADRKRIAWVKSFQTGQHWLLKLRAQYGEKLGTLKNYSLALQRFCEYTEMNPDEIIEAYKRKMKDDVNEAVTEWNDKLELFVPWLVDTKKIKRSTAVNQFAGIKSFFSNNVAIGLTAKTPEYYSESLEPVTIDDLRDKILPLANIYETFEILFLKDSGMSQGDALRLNVSDVEDLGNGFGYIKTVRKKENVAYETFIGPNTIDAMKRVLEYRKRQGCEVTPESPLFVKKTKPTQRQTWNLITSSLARVGERAGVELSTHRLRKTFETYMAVGKVHPVVLKYWMGHKVKSDIEARYIIPPKPEQVKMYIDAYTNMDISPKPDQIKAFIAEHKARLITMTPEQRARYRSELKMLFPKKFPVLLADPKIKELLEPKGRASGGLAAKPKFKEINEDKLLSHLNDGWQIVHNLQNGRVIVRR